MKKTSLKANARNRRRKSIRKKISGTPERPRMAIFRSAKHIYAQIIDDSTHQTLASASTLCGDLRGKFAAANVDAARAVGELLASRAKEANISAVVFDRGGYLYHGRVAALADAAREGGLQF